MGKAAKKVMYAVVAALCVVLVGVGVFLVIPKNQGKTPAGSGTQPNTGALSGSPTQGEKIMVEMKVKDYGTITLELDKGAAPITVDNFVKLANEGFYDGLIFHRVIEDFMIQGGNPELSGKGSAPETIKGEFSANGWDNPIQHQRGVISMARMGNPAYDSASGQFFIVHQTYPSLNGQYAAFGHVVDGMDVVDAIAAVPTDGQDQPLEDVVIESVRVLNNG